FTKIACDVSVLVNFNTVLYYYSSSGIDEEYGEKETLLDEILSLVENEEKQKEKEKKETEENRGKDIRKRAMESLTPKKGDDESNDATPSKRNSSGNIVGYLKEKNEAEMVYRRQELEVKKQQLQLEEDKFQLEKQERIQKLENDKQEKALYLGKCLFLFT
ncbi:cilia- and flagella-associated protein 251-like, partial [Mytilus californianus]|uniref:cilia- and flagella-associated protein 251-like n=1 Tax=Mytilus californianus TaxID=6549 RepID=UPI0022452469